MININENTKMIKNQNHLGGICMILSVLFFSLMDVLIKITHEYDVGQVMFSHDPPEFCDVSVWSGRLEGFESTTINP